MSGKRNLSSKLKMRTRSRRRFSGCLCIKSPLKKGNRSVKPTLQLVVYNSFSLIFSGIFVFSFRWYSLTSFLWKNHSFILIFEQKLLFSSVLLLGPMPFEKTSTVLAITVSLNITWEHRFYSWWWTYSGWREIFSVWFRQATGWNRDIYSSSWKQQSNGREYAYVWLI